MARTYVGTTPRDRFINGLLVGLIIALLAAVSLVGGFFIRIIKAEPAKETWPEVLKVTPATQPAPESAELGLPPEEPTSP